MTLEKAIKYAEEKAEKNSIDSYNAMQKGYEGLSRSCAAYADDYRQLAEWFKELKWYRDIISLYEDDENFQSLSALKYKG